MLTASDRTPFLPDVLCVEDRYTRTPQTRGETMSDVRFAV
jgi:hypothetical protein